MSPSTPPSSPNRAQLQDSLRDLHAQLERTPRLDSEARRTLQTLLSEVHQQLHRQPEADPAQGTAPPSGGPFQRLESVAVGFEAQHPLLARALREFVELCNGAGL